MPQSVQNKILFYEDAELPTINLENNLCSMHIHVMHTNIPTSAPHEIYASSVDIAAPSCHRYHSPAPKISSILYEICTLLPIVQACECGHYVRARNRKCSQFSIYCIIISCECTRWKVQNCKMPIDSQEGGAPPPPPPYIHIQRRAASNGRIFGNFTTLASY